MCVTRLITLRNCLYEKNNPPLDENSDKISAGNGVYT